MKTVRLVVRICSALAVAFLAASLALAAAGCAVPYVERPTFISSDNQIQARFIMNGNMEKQSLSEYVSYTVGETRDRR